MARRLEPSNPGKIRGRSSICWLLDWKRCDAFHEVECVVDGGIVIGLLGGFLVAAIRGSDEL